MAAYAPWGGLGPVIDVLKAREQFGWVVGKTGQPGELGQHDAPD